MCKINVDKFVYYTLAIYGNVDLLYDTFCYFYCIILFLLCGYINNHIINFCKYQVIMTSYMIYACGGNHYINISISSISQYYYCYAGIVPGNFPYLLTSPVGCSL